MISMDLVVLAVETQAQFSASRFWPLANFEFKAEIWGLFEV